MQKKVFDLKNLLTIKEENKIQNRLYIIAVRSFKA